MGLSSSARRGASGLARTARPLWAALRRLPPTASASCSLFSSSETPIRCARVPRAFLEPRFGSGGCSTTFHGRLGAGVTISIDAVPAVFDTGLIKQHPICSKLFSTGMGMHGNSHATTTAAATAARSDQAMQQVHERFETACDDLDSGLFDLDDRHCYCCMQFFGGAVDHKRLKVDGHVWCRACSYQVHSLGAHGGQHPEFATTARPNDRCSGCSGCSY